MAGGNTDALRMAGSVRLSEATPRGTDEGSFFSLTIVNFDLIDLDGMPFQLYKVLGSISEPFCQNNGSRGIVGITKTYQGISHKSNWKDDSTHLILDDNQDVVLYSVSAHLSISDQRDVAICNQA